MIIWKFESDDTRVNYLTGELELLPSYQVTQLCEMSLISFLKIIAALQTSSSLVEYRVHDKLIEHFCEDEHDEFSEYSITMSLGLHLGWAVECAIGSYWKLDVSYLSTNVDIAYEL